MGGVRDDCCPCGVVDCAFRGAHEAYDRQLEKEADQSVDNLARDNGETSGSTDLGNSGGTTFCY